MRTLVAPTEDFIKTAKTILNADIVAGSSAKIPVVGDVNFSINDWIVVGYEGADNTDFCQITAIDSGGITVGTLIYPHKIGEPVIKYRYNKRKFYGALVSGGTYMEITGSGSPATIMVNNPQGTRIEYIGTEGYVYFKSTYFNSTDSTETALADADEVYADESLRYCSLYAIRKQAGLTDNPYISDGLIETYRRRAENEVDSYLNARYQLPLLSASGVNEIPFIVENCTVLLAAGYIDYTEFKGDGDGVKWLGEARGILKSLQGPGGQQLLGSDHQEMVTVVGTGTIQGYPDTVDNKNGPLRYFTMQQNI